jgi:hypothetical protein
MLEQLRAACAKSVGSDTKALEEGPLVTHFGYPAPAEPGSVALKLADFVTVIREADVVRVEKHKSLYRVWTSADANVIIRLEKVAKASGDAGGCECEPKPARGVMARDESPAFDLEIGPVTMLYCQTQNICAIIFGRTFCFNVVVCQPAGGGDATVWPEEDPEED